MYLLIAVPPSPLSTEDDPCGRPRVVGGAKLVAMGPGPGTNNLQEAFEVSSGFTHLPVLQLYMCATHPTLSTIYHGYIHGVLTISTVCIS